MDASERAFETIAKGNLESIQLKKKIVDLAREIDRMHIKTMNRIEGFTTESQNSALIGYLGALEQIAEKINKDFGITVLTSPRD